MSHIKQFGILFFFALYAWSSMADEADEYRLAGTIDAGEKGWLAVLELPDGEQRLLNKGDTIPGGEILDIGKGWITLRDQQGELALSLESSGSHAAFGEVPPEFVNLQASESLRKELDTLGQSTQKEERLAAGISKLLQIPEKGKITSIDDLPVRSANHSLLLLKKTLVADHPVRIAVSGVDGFDAVYLMPAPPADNSN